jgi:N-methylhydantoinase A
MGTSIGFDVGGTFTDFVLVDDNAAAIEVFKHPTTPEDPSEGVQEGLDLFLEQTETDWSDVDRLVHATTIATNTVLERAGAKTALLVTEGFRDVPILGRQKRHDLYDLFVERPDPIVPRDQIYEVPERYHPRQGVVEPLDEAYVEDLAQDLASRYDAVAISYLNSFDYEAHERRTAEILRSVAPTLSITRSSAVSKQYREYERTNTTTVDAYVKPRVEQYLSKIRDGLDAAGYDGSFYVMKSSGGVSTPGDVQEQPVGIIESGPVAGALNARRVGQTVGVDDVFSFDMGGTTAKSCFIVDGRPKRTDVFEVDKEDLKSGSGIPINLSAIDMIEISAGGGSIAAVEDTGRITVGPESAGSDPGPICYMRGGTKPTVSDADLVLGYLNPDYFLGGRMDLDVDGARSGIRDAVAAPLDLSVDEAAWGIKEIVDSSMTRASQIHASERGLDLRNFTMVAFGGAGPLHAAFVARELHVPQVVVPRGAGTASALGLLVADIEFNLKQTHVTRLEPDSLEAVNDIFESLLEEGHALLEDASSEVEAVEVERSVDMRYEGQEHELTVPLPDEQFTPETLEQVADRFQDTYESTYGYSDTDAPIEALTWKVTVRGVTPSPSVPDETAADGDAADARKGTREAYFEQTNGFTPAAVYERTELEPGASFSGPAIVEEVNSTTVVPPGDEATVDGYGNLTIDVDTR